MVVFFVLCATTVPVEFVGEFIMTIPPERPRWHTMLSFQYTGMDLQEIAAKVLAVRLSLGLPDNQFFCSFDYSDWFENQGMDVEAIYQWCLNQQKMCKRVIFRH